MYNLSLRGGAGWAANLSKCPINKSSRQYFNVINPQESEFLYLYNRGCVCNPHTKGKGWGWLAILKHKPQSYPDCCKRCTVRKQDNMFCIWWKRPVVSLTVPVNYAWHTLVKQKEKLYAVWFQCNASGEQPWNGSVGVCSLLSRHVVQPNTSHQPDKCLGQVYYCFFNCQNVYVIKRQFDM